MTVTYAGAAWADIDFGGQTRFIMDEKNGRKNIEIVNDGREPALVQISIGWGNEDASPSLPVAVSKPLLLIPARQRASVEVMYQGEGLPNDRESYFLMSVMEIPKKADAPDTLQFAIRHHLKLLYRPQLSIASQEAIDRLGWTRQPGSSLPSARNDSPYYLTLTDIELKDSNGKACGKVLRHWMLEPYSTQALPDSGCAVPPSGVSYVYISDGGFEHPRTVSLRSAP
ncbi:hypothetical protein WS65_13090 [Burkholderia anthina]|nr:hypothetical protein WS65_13090 [Burkholderia anthina]